METCDFCGFENSEKTHFCRKCGRALLQKKHFGRVKTIKKDKPTGKKKIAKKELLIIVGICFVALLIMIAYALNGGGMQIGRFSSKDGVIAFNLSSGNADRKKETEGKNEPEAEEQDDDSAPGDQDDDSVPGEQESDASEIRDADGESDGDIQLENQEPGTGVPDRLYFSDQVVSQWRENGHQYEGTNLAEIFEFLKLDVGTYNGERCLDGALRNKSKLDFKPIRLVFEFFDENSISLGTEILENKGFYAYNTWLFQVPIRSEHAVQFGVRVLELNGKSTTAGNNK